MSISKCQCGECDYCKLVNKLVKVVELIPDVEICNCVDDFVNSNSVVMINMLDEDMNPSYSIRLCFICGCMEIDEPLFIDVEIEDDI